MKRIIGLGLLISLTACGDAHKREIERIQQKKMTTPEYVVVEIDSCQYIKVEVTHGYSTLTHKGNCKNPIHCRR